MACPHVSISPGRERKRCRRRTPRPVAFVPASKRSPLSRRSRVGGVGRRRLSAARVTCTSPRRVTATARRLRRKGNVRVLGAVRSREETAIERGTDRARLTRRSERAVSYTHLRAHETVLDLV